MTDNRPPDQQILENAIHLKDIISRNTDEAINDLIAVFRQRANSEDPAAARNEEIKRGWRQRSRPAEA